MSGRNLGLKLQLAGSREPSTLLQPLPPSPGQEMLFISEKHASILHAKQLLNRFVNLHHKNSKGPGEACVFGDFILCQQNALLCGLRKS